MPEQLASCHTTFVRNHVIEGHVPLGDVNGLLKERPSDITEIAVPGTPRGPGDDDAGAQRMPSRWLRSARLEPRPGSGRAEDSWRRGTTGGSDKLQPCPGCGATFPDPQLQAPAVGRNANASGAPDSPRR